MAATNNNLATLFPSDFFTKDWILFPDYNTPKGYSRDSFDEDLSALEQECSPLDSGYFSGENLESSPVNKVTVGEVETSHSGTTERVQADASSQGPATLAKANHGSIYDGIKNESTTKIEKGTSLDSKNHKPAKRSMSHDTEDQSLPKSSQIGEGITSPTPLQSWVEHGHLHEFLAYRLEQPAKRRKTGSARQ